MSATINNQWLNFKTSQNDYLLPWLEAFLNDRKAQGFTRRTMHFYKTKLSMFADFCASKLITHIT
jgi:hypothetical protein